MQRLFPLAIIALTTQLAAAQTTTLPADLQARYDTLRQAYLTGDAQMLRSLYAADATLLDVSNQSIPLEAALAASSAETLKVSKLDIRFQSVKLDDERATVVNQQDMGAESIMDTLRVPLQVTALAEDIWRKVNGQWLITASRVLESETRVAGQIIKQVAPPLLTDAQLAERRMALQMMAQPIRSVAAAAQDPDFSWLTELTRGARLIGAGEGSHGTAEHFQLKDRMFRELVQHHGFTVFAIEADFDDAYEVDRFVRGEGPNDPDAATRAFDFWTWQTQEVRDLLAWMRQYNASRGDKAELRVVGIDMQDPSGSLDLLTRLAPPDRRVQAALKTLGSVTAHDWATLAEGTPERLADLRMQVGELQAALSTLPPRTPQRATLLHLAETMRQGTTMLTSGDQDANRLNLIRDAAMFGNTRTALDVLFPGQKAMLWAHNFHISKVPAQGQSYVNLGQHLARALGTSYRTVGFSFGDGELRAVSGDPAQQVKGPVVLTAAPAPRDSLDTLISGNAPAIYLNVAQARQNPVLNAWLAQPIRIASVGAVYTPGLPTGANVVLPQAFDGVIFVKRSSAAGALGRK
ncbi:erythromycin esterase family protein [Deinococcus gobiensis]|uniref:Erythromycin esterase, putative n=1 Tax=Deinococcus gobiensis (strain DSM 21396 / JCM 16679 / CGMCC 1.7299 / I-0) TaxID=745776 RepID=H8H336_DEIGI|nr:erythromycin esterase family protein [Deinococcus gobiensis]AFD27933.1 Erythromycin esterase, putative [Deinococcus gobiensis I-0]